LDLIAWAVIDKVTPNPSIAITFYDAIMSFWDGIKTTTEVRAPHIVYSWSMITTAVFAYVRLENQTDDYQWLSHVSTKTKGEIGYQMPTVEYKYSSDGWTKVPTAKAIQGNKPINIEPSGYNSTLNAIIAYNSGSSVPVQEGVQRIQISGPESKTIQYIYPYHPQLPLNFE